MSGRTSKAHRKALAIGDDGTVLTPAHLAEGLIVSVISSLKASQDVLYSDLDTDNEQGSLRAHWVISAAETGRAVRVLEALDRRRLLPKHNMAFKVLRLMRDRVVKAEQDDDPLAMVKAVARGLESLHIIMLYQTETRERVEAMRSFAAGA